MATIDHSRGVRLSPRSGADRPQTNAKSARSSANSELPSELPAGSSLFAMLSDVRLHLEVAQAAAAVCARALKGQSADSDLEISVVLQRTVADEIDRQIERLDVAVKGARHGQ